MNKSFVWTIDFETGLQAVDNQHHHLIDLINQFSDSVVNQSVSAESSANLFRELKDYTHYHFSEEETMMESVGLHPQVIAHHKNIHNEFIDKVVLMENQLDLEATDDCETVLHFLYQWLGHHILGEDQSMARQVNAIQSGISAEEAFLTEKNAEMAEINLPGRAP